MTRTRGAAGRAPCPGRPPPTHARPSRRCRRLRRRGRRRSCRATATRGPAASRKPSPVRERSDPRTNVAVVNEETIARLADLAVHVGANVQPDQIVSVNSEPHKEYLTRAVARSAYKAGARFVDVQWFDPWVKRE